MTKQMVTKIEIPKELTGKQATAVLKLLDNISTAIWEIHETKILKTIQQQNQIHSKSLNLENDLPF